MAQWVALAPNLNRRASRGRLRSDRFTTAQRYEETLSRIIAALEDWPVTGLLSPLKSIVRFAVLFEMRPLHVCLPLIALLSTLALAEAQALEFRLALVGETYLLPAGGRIRGEKDVKFSAVSAPEIVDAGAPAPKAGESDAQQAQLRPPPISKQAPVATLELAGIYRVSGTNPNGSQYHGMVALSRNRDEFTLTWWIGEQVLHGTGRVADKMLVVNWGDKDPAIYTFGDGGVLDGVWADGSATETLVPIATSASEPRALWPGKYKAEGRNPNGTRYAGTVTITKHGKVYQLSWAIGSTSYKGSGTLKDNLLIVNWGSPTPVIYALTDDGSLSGLWDAGRGEETLTPAE